MNESLQHKQEKKPPSSISTLPVIHPAPQQDAQDIPQIPAHAPVQRKRVDPLLVSSWRAPATTTQQAASAICQAAALQREDAHIMQRAASEAQNTLHTEQSSMQRLTASGLRPLEGYQVTQVQRFLEQQPTQPSLNAIQRKALEAAKNRFELRPIDFG